MLSCDKRLQPDTWNPSGSQENVIANPRSTLESSQIPYRRIHQFATPSATGEVPVHMSTGTPVARDEGRIGSTIPMPTFASRPSTMNSFMPVEILQSSMVGQQRQQISELQFDKFSTQSTFACWKIRFKTEVCICSQFPTKAMLWIKEVEMVDSVDDLKSSCSTAGKNFPNFEMLDAEIASALNKIIQNSQFKKKVSLEEQKSHKEERFQRGRQIAFMIYDYFRVTGAHDTVLDYADFFSVTLHDDNIQELDTRWDEVLLSMSQIPPRWYLGKSVQIEDT